MRAGEHAAPHPTQARELGGRGGNAFLNQPDPEVMVLRALEEADRPLRAREIHQAVQKLAATPLSWNTVKDCLHKNARRPTSPIERIRHGLYTHR